MKKTVLLTFAILIILVSGYIGLNELSNKKTKKYPPAMIKKGLLKQNEIWSGEIYISDTIEIPQGVTLTIEPGTVIKFRHSRDYKNFDKGCLLINGGILKAIGTPTKQIWFTSDAKKPINGDWEGIIVKNSKGKNIIKYAVIEYAFIGARFWKSFGVVSNSIIRWINAEGIYAEQSNLLIEKNTIYATGYNGIAMEQFNEVTIKNNKIFNNQGSGIHGEATKAIIENNIIQNSKTGITFDDYSYVVLRNNLVENIANEALHFYVHSTGELYFNKIRNNGVGISAFLDSKLTARNNDIYRNTINLEFSSMHKVDFKNNWWGTTDEIKIKEKIQSDIDFSFKPFLDKETADIPKIIFDYKNIKNDYLKYIPGDPEDKYPYIYPDKDETRRVIKKICGEKEGFKRYGFGWSLAWDGKYLWRSLHAGSADFVKIDPETGKIVASLNNPGIAQDRGITFDGRYLWVNDFTARKVFKIDPETGKLISSFDIPKMEGGASGITWDGQYLYLVDWAKQNRLYQVDRKGKLINIVELEKEGGASITYDGKYFWMTPSGKGVRKYNKQGKLVGEIYASAFGGEAIAHDGKYLWIIHRTQELRNDQKLYKIEIVNDQLLLY